MTSGNWFRKLPGSHREPPGLEWRIWKKLPTILLAGTLIPLMAYGLAHLFPVGDPLSADKRLQTMGILVVAFLATFWTAMLTLGFACFIVRVMKGPAYVADEYPLMDADKPKPQDKADSDKPAL